jgi:hypothetical protein
MKMNAHNTDTIGNTDTRPRFTIAFAFGVKVPPVIVRVF